MAGQQSRSNHPITPSGDAKVRHLQRRLWAAAKRSPERRFHALYDRVYRDDVLKEGFDFLGCHLRKRMSGRLWEKYGRRRYYLQRWPSRSAMKQVRSRIRDLTNRRWNHVKDVRELIKRLNPVLRGWGNYFRTGNASERFQEIDHHTWWRLNRFMKKRKGRNLRAGDSAKWSHQFFWDLGLHRLLGTVQFPGGA
jgi:hypothetical protein